MRRVAVVGAGIAGLAAARALSGHAQVTLFEAADHFGGHAHTVDVTLDGWTHAVDTGFLVFNERTYPRLIELFGELGVATAESDMSFSVRLADAAGASLLEWGGRDLGSLFAQRRNLVRPAFWRMLADLLRFNREATDLARDGNAHDLAESVEDFLQRRNFSREFRDWYFLPMIGCIWSCPPDQMLRFPIATMVRFCDNHGLLQIANRPRWRTVRGGSRVYVDRMLERIPDARLHTPVRRIVRGAGGVQISTDAATDVVDEVVLACHSDQALGLLADPSADEREVLGAIRYQPNRAVLHTDTSLLPERRAVWSAWNYERLSDGAAAPSVCLHYWLNQLQPLPFTTPVFVTLNPLREPRADRVHASFDYEHPVFDRAAIDAQRKLPALQGDRQTWFCGAWTGYGFHEDGLKSGLAVAEQIRERRAGASAQALKAA
jgi:predicted NAD/FAD-binding protein